MMMHKQPTISVTGQLKYLLFYRGCTQGITQSYDTWKSFISNIVPIFQYQGQIIIQTWSLIWFRIFKGFAFGANSAWVFKQSTLTQSPFLKTSARTFNSTKLKIIENKLGLIVLLPIRKVLVGVIYTINVWCALCTRMGLLKSTFKKIEIAWKLKRNIIFNNMALKLLKIWARRPICILLQWELKPSECESA